MCNMTKVFLFYTTTFNRVQISLEQLCVNDIMMRFGQTGLNVNRFETGLSASVNRA